MPSRPPVLSHPTNAFAALGHDEQIARFDALAGRALTHFGLSGAQYALLNTTNNAVYQVAPPYGARFALRISRPGRQGRAQIESELWWLRRLNATTPLRAPRPAADLYAGALDGVDAPVYCTLFAWQDGQSAPPDALTPAHMIALGQFIAALHAASPPADFGPQFQRPRLDAEGLLGVEGPYNPGAGAALFTDAQLAVMDAARAQISAALEVLDDQPDGFGPIHADLIWKNVLFDAEKLADADALSAIAAIDFDDCAYGYRLYDLAPMLLSLKDEPDGPELSLLLWETYRTASGLSADWGAALEALTAARHIASIRWVAGNAANPALRERAPQIIAERVRRLEHFVQTGVFA